MISPYVSYFLGILTILLPLMILYILTYNYIIIDIIWGSLFCVF